MTPEEERLASQLERTLASYRDTRDRYFAALSAGDSDKAREMRELLAEIAANGSGVFFQRGQRWSVPTGTLQP